MHDTTGVLQLYPVFGDPLVTSINGEIAAFGVTTAVTLFLTLLSSGFVALGKSTHHHKT